MTKTDRIWSLMFCLSDSDNAREKFLVKIDAGLPAQYNTAHQEAVDDPECMLDEYFRKNAWNLGLRGSRPVNYGDDAEYDAIYNMALAFRKKVQAALEQLDDIKICRLYKQMASA